MMMCPSDWNIAKIAGSDHYKTGGVEPIDLYKAGGYFEHFAICNIIKYAFRCGKRSNAEKITDLNKVIHYAILLKAHIEEASAEGGNNANSSNG